MSQNMRATGASLAAPREDLEGVGIRHGEHVGLLDAAEALDGRAVEGHALLEGVLELGRGDGEALELAEHVGEPEPDEAHAALLDGPEDVVELVLHPESLAGPGGLAGGRVRRESPVHSPFTLGQRPRNRPPGSCRRASGPPACEPRAAAP